jgi:thiamine biosynthesis protein ThiS|tara:strand:- start:223 stop:441 length:219 start_codon:yes stop_codon:yes gene_type:complete
MKIKNKIKIKLNGKTMELNENTALFDLIKRLKIPLNKVALELNRKIIDKKRIKKIKLFNKDVLEIVHFIGGG